MQLLPRVSNGSAFLFTVSNGSAFLFQEVCLVALIPYLDRCAFAFAAVKDSLERPLSFIVVQAPAVPTKYHKTAQSKVKNTFASVLAVFSHSFSFFCPYFFLCFRV